MISLMETEAATKLIVRAEQRFSGKLPPFVLRALARNLKNQLDCFADYIKNVRRDGKNIRPARSNTL